MDLFQINFFRTCHQLGADSHEMVSIQKHIRIWTVLPPYVRVIARYLQKAESTTHILVSVFASLLLGSSNLTPRLIAVPTLREVGR